MPLINLSLSSFFNSVSDSDDRFQACAVFISRRLGKAREVLSELDLCFEADEAEEMAGKWLTFSEDDGTADGFADLWNSLEDWACGSVTVNGKTQELSRVPSLPDQFAC